MAWLYINLLHYAAYKEGYSVDSELPWERGQLRKTYKKLSEYTGFSVKIVRTLLQKMGQATGTERACIGQEGGRNGLLITINDYIGLQEYGKDEGHEEGTKRAGNGHEEGNIYINNKEKHNKEVEEGGSKAATTTLEQMRIIARSGNGSRQYKKESKDQEIVSKLLMDTSERKLIKAWNQFVSDPSVSRWHTHRPITVALFETWLPDYQSVYERFE